MGKNKSIIRQTQEKLNSKLRYGESKDLAKKEKRASEGIYSYSTRKTYIAKCSAFAKWARDNHGCRTIDDARKYVDTYRNNL